MHRLNQRLLYLRIWVRRHEKEIILTTLIIILVTSVTSIMMYRNESNPQIVQTTLPTLTPFPTKAPFSIYHKPILAHSERYDIYLIGDSMMHAFGPRGGKFNEILSAAYPETFFEISNYAQANQNIMLLPARLSQPVQADHDLLLHPILDGQPDVIIIESFGYNPLSQFGRTEGLIKQEELLTQVMTTLTERFPNTVIMFLAAIAPDKKTYGISINKTSPDQRWAQAEERIEYITNHIDYAIAHNIPLINAYQESLDTEGDGDTRYINPDDDIHPSEEGLALMGRVMTARIVEENIFPKN